MSEQHKYTEHCGVIGTIGPDIDAAEFGNGWWRLRNRGDGAWGLITKSNGRIQSDQVQKLESNENPIPLLNNSQFNADLRLGHNRYATSGSKEGNIQPFLLELDEFVLGLAHNGNIPREVVNHLRLLLREQLSEGVSDSRVMAQLLLEQRARHASWEETFIAILPHIQGAFSLACLTDDDVLYAVRDPWGIHPLCIGRKENSWVVVSESVALDTMGAKYIREVAPGEMVRLSADGELTSTQYAKTEEGEWLCAIELIYFAKNESLIRGRHVRDERQALGRAVGKRFQDKNISVDYVIPILNSGKQMSMGVSDVLGMENTVAITVNTDERSFIQNTPSSRAHVVNKKHVVDGKFVEGKRILLCDDSLVRGTSLEALLEKIKEHNPAEIHIVLGSEPVIDTCDLGVDLPTRTELLAHRLMQERPDFEDPEAYALWLSQMELTVAQRLGVNSVTYLDRSSVNVALQRSESELCQHCFGGTHPIQDHMRPEYLAEQQVAVS